jgi:hypothetical protein
MRHVGQSWSRRLACPAKRLGDDLPKTTWYNLNNLYCCFAAGLAVGPPEKLQANKNCSSGLALHPSGAKPCIMAGEPP